VLGAHLVPTSLRRIRFAGQQQCGDFESRASKCLYWSGVPSGYRVGHSDNLNDIAKDHPDRVIATCTRWLTRAPPGRRWIVNRALRSLVKSTHSGALQLVGAGDAPKVRIAQQLLVDYSVHFVKADGEPRAKVFKLRRLELLPKVPMRLSGQVSFAGLTTRRHYPGVHRIEVGSTEFHADRIRSTSTDQSRVGAPTADRARPVAVAWT